MAIAPFQSFTTSDKELGTLLTNLRLIFKSLSDTKIVQGQLINISLPTVGADNTVYHGLDRKPNGFIVVQQSAQATIWWSGTCTETTMKVRTSAAITGKAWVF